MIFDTQLSQNRIDISLSRQLISESNEKATLDTNMPCSCVGYKPIWIPFQGFAFTVYYTLIRGSALACLDKLDKLVKTGYL